MYITNGQLYDYVTAMLHRAQPQVEIQSPFWRTITDQAAVDAYNYITAALSARGYGSASQVPYWDEGIGFQKAIGAYLSLTAGGALGAFDDKFVKQLDRRDELKTVQITIAGVWQAPDGTGGSPLSWGTGRVGQIVNPFPGGGEEVMGPDMKW